MSVNGDHDSPILTKTYVSPRQMRILMAIQESELDVDELASRLNVKREDLMRDIEELKSKGLLEVERVEVPVYVLTKEGERCLKSGLPEENVLSLLSSLGSISREELTRKGVEKGFKPEEIEIGIAQLAAGKALIVESGLLKLVEPNAHELVERNKSALELIARGQLPEQQLLNTLRRRGLVELRKRTKLRLRATGTLSMLLSKGLLAEAPVITELTPEILESDSWRYAVFKPFDLKAEPPSIPAGRKHPYLEFLDWLREILVEMGFEEMKGPHVELELWNFDALFQAQDHPAREIHDTYFVKGNMLGEIRDLELLKRIASAHENGGGTGSKGWGYKWDPLRAARLILRTQTTAVSARTLYQRGAGEYMCFSLDRVFRPENLDAKHSMEFYQLEGIIVGRKVTFRNLLGFFNEMARRLGLGEVKVKPAYFPFTEPSVEGFIKHEKLGWIEVFPGGMFRPEMLAALGVKGVNVAAWGIGIDRIAMTVLGIDDIRLLFTQDLDFIRRAPRPLPTSLLR
ncbi:phenylalanine--tRNA ligase subunit alpha [Infirmifilum uzonense]|uniref:phenylalanine--tRNA ligase subunit alpha n=1 Tax=Infirmifilum uzonense TaxID=1550241 RepID=UPI000699D2A1|nr:phenylalanine--tRNA ligase subunit alpha [Infirmifilum uzonense]